LHEHICRILWYVTDVACVGSSSVDDVFSCFSKRLVFLISSAYFIRGCAVSCDPCFAGFFRVGCGTNDFGTCEECPNLDLGVGLRTFKPDVGNASDVCRLCTVCGGGNQNGTEYDMERCLPWKDTVCTSVSHSHRACWKWQKNDANCCARSALFLLQS
jgi:hypothetical protein